LFIIPIIPSRNLNESLKSLGVEEFEEFERFERFEKFGVPINRALHFVPI